MRGWAMKELNVIEPGRKRLHIPRYFTKEMVNPFEMFTYERRSSIIKNPDGSLVFEMNNVEVPTFWTQVATDILAQKYFRKAGIPQRDEKGKLLLDENGKIITGSETRIKQGLRINWPGSRAQLRRSHYKKTRIL